MQKLHETLKQRDKVENKQCSGPLLGCRLCDLMRYSTVKSSKHVLISMLLTARGKHDVLGTNSGFNYSY